MGRKQTIHARRWRLIGPSVLGLALAHCALVTECSAQITLDGSLGPQQALAGPNFTIDSTVGQIRGTNLFHSFGRFNVQQGQSATFTNSLPNPIANILSRVTGGERSFIDGTLRSSIAGANLYLLNPSGVMFGPNAVLDVSGSFHVSTADYLRLQDGARFFANLNQASVLTVAQPAAFGFLGPNAAPLSVQGSFLEVPVGRTLSVVGGDVTITGSTLFAPGGQVGIAGVGSAGEVTPVGAAASADLRLDGFSQLGNVTISQSTLSTNGLVFTTNAAGSIMIRGGQIVVESSGVNAIGNPGGVVRIGAEGLDLSGTDVNTGTRGVANHAGTAVDVAVTGLVTLRNGSEIASSSFGLGRAGGVRFRAGSVVLGDDDPATSPFSGVGFYGDIGSRAFFAGRGGDVEITAGDLTIKNGFFINTAALSTGDAGNVTVRANTLRILDGASISSNGLGLGRGGVVDIEVGEALISARNINSVPNCNCVTGVAAQTGFGSPGGAIRIKADVLRLLDGGQVNTLLFSTGPGANTEIIAKQLIISGVVEVPTVSPSDVHAGIDARVIGIFASGTGGNIRVIADSVDVADGGFISSGLFAGAPGTAGNITIEAGRVDIRNRGSVSASSVFGSGNAGNIAVTADTLVITGIRDSFEPFTSTDFTGLATTTGVSGKKGGDINLVAGTILVTDKGAIDSASLGAGDAGNIRIMADSLLVTERAVIQSSAFGSGRGGNIDVRANHVSVSGAGAPLAPTDSSVSAIASQSRGDSGGSGAAGDVTITAGSLQVLDGAKVSTQTAGPGNGGNVNIQAGSVLVSGINGPLDAHFKSLAGADDGGARAAIIASSERVLLGDKATGNAGQVRIAGGDVQVNSGGLISSRTNTPGRGGNIEVSADRVTLAGGALVSADSSTSASAGKAGDISINASDTVQIAGSSITTTADRAEGGAITIAGNQVQLIDGALVSAKSSGAGNAGNVTIIAGDTLLARSSTVSTEATLADGGNLMLIAPTMVHLIDSKITTSVGTGQGKGGNITIDPQFVILNRSEIRADAFGGPGGSISISADVFLTQESVLSASSALSAPGTIDIQARITDISGDVARLPESAPPVAALLRASCAARLAGGSISSLVVAGREGLPPDPEGVLPSPLLAGGTSVQPHLAAGLAYHTAEPPRFSLLAADRLCSGFSLR